MILCTSAGNSSTAARVGCCSGSGRWRCVGCGGVGTAWLPFVFSCGSSATVVSCKLKNTRPLLQHSMETAQAARPTHSGFVPMPFDLRAMVCAVALVCAGAVPAVAQTAAPRATIETSLGSIVIQLDAEHTPATVANFVRYAREGHFDGTVIYRVVPGFVIQ